MKKATFYFILFYSLIYKLESQNLVPNPSFETIDVCNVDSLQAGIYRHNAPPWDSPSGGSCDLFNTCCTVPLIFSVPSNYYGYQYPHSGNGYAGGGLFIGGREYMQVKLDSPLVANQEYCASFYISLGSTQKVACNNFGMYFSTSHLYVPTINYLNFTPQINDTSIITDTLNWTLVYGHLTAQGGERYLLIGNFYPDSLTDSVHLNYGTDPTSSYYYFDDVNVHCCSCDSVLGLGVKEISNVSKYKLYPNPNTGNMTLEYTLESTDVAIFSIYSMDGRLVKQQMLNAQNNIANIDAANLDAGIYYYTVKESDKNTKSEKLIIIK